MGTSFRKPVAPSADKRWKIVEASMRRLGNQSHALIEALHTVQESFGYLDTDSLRFVATSLRVPLSQAFGVATVYHYFTMKPPGKHTCVVCTGTACYIKGAGKLLTDMEKQYGIKPGETTADGNVSLLTARCRAEAIVNRTGERWRARKAAGLQDRSAILSLISGNNRQIELCSDPLTVRIVPLI
jgi:bidirectional [NiFe] hydrogenase diaphorase subunit